MVKDDLKRGFLTRSIHIGSALALSSLIGSHALANNDFDDYKSSMSAGLFSVEDEFAQYKKAYAKAYRDYQEEISQFWSEVELSDSKTWVDYNSAMDVKRVFDFSKNEIRISVQGHKLENFTPADTEREILKALSLGLAKAYRIDPVLAKIVGGQEPLSQRKIMAVDKSLAAPLAKTALLQRKAGKKGDLLIITAKLPKDSLSQRADTFLPSVQKSADKWQVSAPLIMAIMHTESAFNPLARSHIPAFGLMQIVPKSAGRDASRLVFGEERLLVGRDLFEPETNIEMGAAYLHILDTQYLKGITDPASRQICVIAAYNTGAGNVARAFTGTSSIKKALPLINRLSSQQIYAHLRSKLKYEEARNYIKKVTELLPHYL